MSHKLEKAKIMLVLPNVITDHPNAFQEYVRQYFREQEYDGVNYYSTILRTSLIHDYNAPGCFPSDPFVIDLFGQHYGMGKPSLSKWIINERKKNPSHIREIHVYLVDVLGLDLDI